MRRRITFRLQRFALVVCFFRMRSLPPKCMLALSAPLLVRRARPSVRRNLPHWNCRSRPRICEPSRKGNRVTLTWTAPSDDRSSDTRAASARRSFAEAWKNLTSAELRSVKPPPETSSAAQVFRADGSTLVHRHAPCRSWRATILPHSSRMRPRLERGGRSAGLSNQVRVPLAHTLPPPRDFIARVTDEGVV